MAKLEAVLLLRCVYEPRGERGLEGYQCGDQYLAHRVRYADGRQGVRVWPVPGDDYYEACTLRDMRRFFEIDAEFKPQETTHV